MTYSPAWVRQMKREGNEMLVISTLSATEGDLISEIFQHSLWSEWNLQTLSPPWHIVAHPCLSVYINLSERLILKWRSLFPLLSAFASLLMQGEMDCCRENGDWICPHIHPHSSTGNTLHCIQLHYCILCINSDWVWPWHTAAFTESGDSQPSG